MAEPEKNPYRCTLLKCAVQHTFNDLAQSVASKEFCRDLFANHVVDQKEHEHLKQELENKGSIAQAELALKLLLNKSEEKFNQGLNVLQRSPKGKPLHESVNKTVARIEAGHIKLTLDQTESSDPKRLAVSIATILLSDAEEIVRLRLKKEIQNSSFRDISKALKEKEKLLRDYKEGRNGKPQLLLKGQFQKLFPHKSGNKCVDLLDLTMLTLLYKVIFCDSLGEDQGLAFLPKEDDNSTEGHLQRLKYVRNWCYANLVKAKSVRVRVFSLLEKALTGLGTKQKKNHWVSVLLYPDMEQEGELKKNLRSLIASDVQEIRQIMQVFQVLSKGCNLEEQQQTDNIVSSIQSSFIGNREQIFKLVDCVSAEMGHALLLHQEIVPPESPIRLEKQVETCLGNLTKTVQTQLEKQTKQLRREIVKKMDFSQLPIEDDIGSFRKNQEQLHSMLTSPEVFKVLVLTEPGDRENDDLKELCVAIGSVKWDVLVDLDYKSRTSNGLQERIAKALEEHKHFRIITYAEVDAITESEEVLIASGDKMLWLLMNGCEDVGIKPLNKGNKVKAFPKLEFLISSLLSKLPGRKSLTCLNIILGDTENVPDIVQQVVKRIDSCCDECGDFIDQGNSNVYSIHSSDYSRLVPKTSLDHHTLCLTPLDMVSMLCKNFYRQRKTKTFQYPGSDDRECHVTADRLAQYRIYITLYHKDIGFIDFEKKNESEIEQIMENHRTNFLKGQPLEPEAQFIQSRCQIFVVRKEMENALSLVKALLKDREEWHKRKPNGYFTIQHDSSGGGTTTARYLLYSLRKEYPCIEIRRVEKVTIEILEKLFQESKKPLLIVLDNHDFTPKIADELQQELFNEHVKALVIHVSRKSASHFKHQHFCWQADEDLLDEAWDMVDTAESVSIPAKLKPEDKAGFKQLYNNVAKGIRASRVILYGLLAFCDDYDRGRLDEHISQWFGNSNSKQIQALGVVILVWRYCQRPFKVTLLNCQSTESHKEILWRQLFGYYGSDFVKEDQNDEYSACPVHSCIIEPILKQLEKEMKWATESDTLKWFTESLHEMLGNCDGTMEEIGTATRHLFIERPTGSYLSNFLTAIKHECGNEYAAEQICNFRSLFSDKHKAHMRALYARYLTYHLNNPEEGIVEITTAVGLKKGEDVLAKHATKETAILATYGFLYRDKAKSVFESMKEKTQVALAHSVPLFTEAINAFQKAQMTTMDSKRYTVGPFFGEVKVRLRLLKLCFNHCCRRKLEEFQKFLKNTPFDVIRESEEKAMEVLENVDHLERLNLLDELSVHVSAAVVRFKFQLLRFRFDDNKTKHQLIKSVNASKDLSFDIGLLIRLQYDKVTTVEEESFQCRLRHWSELTDEELQTIISFVRKKLEGQSRHVLASNFSDILNAMIQIRYKKQGHDESFSNYNLEYAILCAQQWMKYYPRDQRAPFYLGSLELVKGLEQGNEGIIKEAVDILNKTDEMCKETPSARDFMARTFAIGKGTGLSKLMPYKKDIPREELCTFSGRQVTSTSMIIGVSPYQSFLKAKMYREDNKHIPDGQQSKLKFCICLRQKFPIVAFYVEKL